MVKSLATVLLKDGIIYMYLAFIYENFIISGFLKIAKLNFMFILRILTCSSKIYVIGKRFFKIQTSLNPVSMNIVRRHTKIKLTDFI